MIVNIGPCVIFKVSEVFNLSAGDPKEYSDNIASFGNFSSYSSFLPRQQGILLANRTGYPFRDGCGLTPFGDGIADQSEVFEIRI